jgi:hypothetical protein
MTVLDGKEPTQAFEKVSDSLFSPDGTRLAFFGKRQGKWNMTLSGEAVGAPFDDLEEAMFSPDGQRLAFVGRRGSKYVVVVDAKEGPLFDVVGGLGFSQDGRRVGYASSDVKSGFGGDKGRGQVVIDGEPGPQFEGEKSSSVMQKGSSFVLSLPMGATTLAHGYFHDLAHRLHGVSAPVFSADGAHVAYVAHRGKEDEVVMVDGQPGPKFEAITAGPRYCRSGQRLAYAARRDKDDEVVVVDEKPGAKYRAIVAGPQFCNEGRHLAYVASDSGGKYLVVDEARVGAAMLPKADFVSEPLFAPDGRRVAHVAATASFWAAFARNLATGIGSSEKALRKTAKRRVYMDGEPGDEYDSRAVANLQFSADSRHAVFVVDGVQEGPRTVSFVVTDRTALRKYDAVWAETLSIQDAKRIVYAAQSGRKFVRVTQALQ